MNTSEILLHTCCAPCTTASAERLIENNLNPILFFSNSNIHPRSEYALRLENTRKLADKMKLELYVDEYDHEAWLAFVKGFESEPEGGARCRLCFRFNLKRAADKTAELGLSQFTTTLSVSPHKNSKTLFETGTQFPGFREWNFKKMDGYKRSLELSREMNLYRQNWCGCEFSTR